jgi:predicted  nucleic acid-binding Zn-ribbon protein
LNEQIKILVELQKIDSEIYALKKELAAYPELQKKLEADFEKKKSRLKTSEEQLKSLQLKQKEKEGDLQGKEEKIRKLQAQLYQLKSNKEYAAMELEIKGGKADTSLLEEEILGLLDAVDQARGAVTGEKEALAAEEKKMKGELAALNQKAETFRVSLSVAETKRKAFTPNLEPKLSAQYERVLKTRDGLAIVPVKNNSCGGCHIGLPPQFVNEVQLQEKLMTCESCARILYWPS